MTIDLEAIRARDAAIRGPLCDQPERDRRALLAAYDALAERLAKAESALRRIMDGNETATPWEIAAAYLSKSDSAPAVGAARYRLQAKADPYKWADFDAKLWNLIVVPADQPTVRAK